MKKTLLPLICLSLVGCALSPRYDAYHKIPVGTHINTILLMQCEQIILNNNGLALSKKIDFETATDDEYENYHLLFFESTNKFIGASFFREEKFLMYAAK